MSNRWQYSIIFVFYRWDRAVQLCEVQIDCPFPIEKYSQNQIKNFLLPVVDPGVPLENIGLISAHKDIPVRSFI